MPAATLPARPSRSKEVLDDLIMGTNSSSIVSKRSVERLYYANEPHYFRYFVQKPQRRAPLINRGYWLRLKAIDVVVRQFLSRPSTNTKIIVNLGCGSDVLPWQCHARYGDVCQNALFVDVDYPDLMRKKRVLVRETPQLSQLLGPDASFSESDNDPVLIKSPAYCQIACDLRQLEMLRRTLASLVPLDQAEVLFVAEVSITYMDTPSTDSLIEWASSIGKVEFCLLEQIIPEGPEQPFAKTMLKHFDKLNTPIKSVRTYPSLESQRNRFQSRGWAHVDTWDLWETWLDDSFVTPPERQELDAIEPFDEWEEFMLFGRHYCLLHARAVRPDSYIASASTPPSSGAPSSKVEVVSQTHSRPIRRRFGNTAVISSVEGSRYAAHIMGLGKDSRSDTCDLYSLGDSRTSLRLPLHGPPPRMCSTLTALGEYGTLLAGGRASPSKAFSDCWLLKRGSDGLEWEKTWDLPVSLFRHSATRLGNSSLVLVMGGKMDQSRVSENSFVFNPEMGWLKSKVIGERPKATFGSVICNSEEFSNGHGTFTGLLFGGMLQDGTLCSTAYTWKLDLQDGQPAIWFQELGVQYEALSIFGADLVELGPSTVAVCGGTGSSPRQQGQSITFISTSGGQCSILAAVDLSSTTKGMPFMIGSSVFLDDTSLTVLGGGATCFSMGTFWETRSFHIGLPQEVLAVLKRDGRPLTLCEYLESPKVLPKPRQEDSIHGSQGKVCIRQIPREKITDVGAFERILREGKPVILEGLDVGTCVDRWTPEYLVGHVGKDKEVVVHECQGDSGNLDFNSKNFQYVTDKFSNVINRISNGDRLYLRSLSQDQPSQSAADMDKDFPGLAPDFRLPKELAFVKERRFSSVLRLSGRVNMWLHYDVSTWDTLYWTVMANVYTQIKGTKRMILFPPSDVRHLAFAPGASSSSLDVFSSLNSQILAPTHPHEATLGPGDILVLPPMWLHTATPMSDLSVAVNVFFRDMETGCYAAGRDVYGNRDLEAYEKGRADATKISKSFEKLPPEIRRFYLSRIADQLMTSAEAAE
ncbi:tRNA wybutosine-synthesizing protein 4 [Geosmithia morbida]|uniref:tRNA wybutosine-synthesizing protein 4 n=1 Tax=Geosmithia morbida TaxID=1094350 RepID=A0A9P5CYY7_9HYPO|nr:tRNA wybutosine-synthesizing protein 4 [Geosmithia morbida]KAF4120978.1 tRNA wybutosine-synthesizing protein 4 [Geosmithia morbida]